MDHRTWTARQCAVHARLELEHQLRRFLLGADCERIELRATVDEASGDVTTYGLSFNRAGSQAAMSPWRRVRHPLPEESLGHTVRSTLLNFHLAERCEVALTIYGASGKPERTSRYNVSVDELHARARALVAVVLYEDPAIWLDEAQRSNCHYNTLLYVLHLTDASSSILWYTQEGKARGELRLVSLSRLGLRTDRATRRPPLSVGMGRGVVGVAAISERATVVDQEALLQLSENPQLVRGEGWVTCLSLPLMFDSECVGVLSLYQRDDELEIAETVKVVDKALPVASIQAARASRDHRRHSDADKMISGAMRLQAGLAMVGLVHDLAKHAKNVHQWADSLREPLKVVSLRAGIKQTVDDMISSADVVGKITSTMDKLALGREDNVVRIRIDERLDALRPVLRRLDSKITVTIDGQASVLGPDSLVERIVFNLVMNSMHWTDKKGTIEVFFSVHEGGNVAVLTVVDNGQGMSPEQIAVAREPFESFRENGSGLGLFLVDQLCQVVGATLRISSEPFISTTVSVTFERLVKDERN